LGKVNHAYLDRETRKTFGLNMKIIIDNIGERSTSINDIEFLSVEPIEYLTEFKKQKGTWETLVPAHQTKHVDNNITIQDYPNKVTKTDIITGILKISYTHMSWRRYFIPFFKAGEVKFTSKIQK
jgi:hypothetical protein